MRGTTPLRTHVQVRHLLLAVVSTATVAAGVLTMATLSDPPDEALPASIRAASRAGPTSVAQAGDRAGGAARVGKSRPGAAASLAPESRRALVYVGSDGEHITEERIRRYLVAQGSPLAEYAHVIVEAGVRNDVDPRVVIAISAAESSFGTRQLGHNAWGWGASTVEQMVRWPDWPTAIREYTAALGAEYDTDPIDTSFAQRYVPPNWRNWLQTVTRVYAEI